MSLSANRSDITGGTNVWMQIELRDAYLFGPNNYLHKYTVVAHESYHVYQRSFPDVPSKWLREGAAATFESLYSQQFLDEDYFFHFSSDIDPAYLADPTILEKNETRDPNYSSSLFMVLVLANELQKQGISETEAFRLILKDFWERAPGENWKPTFQELFNTNVEKLYEVVAGYQADLNEASLANCLGDGSESCIKDVKQQILEERFYSLTPSTSLKLSKIFGSGN